ncbi:MAG: DNA alkylation repair protein [Candidatus Pacebacteria bacterium]|nr:DNA alkylation repair protein [Candidatus Paceibacterota bacterium]
MNCEEIIKKLKAQGRVKNIAGMERFGIHPKDEKFGVSMPDIRKIAKGILKEIKKDNVKRHNLALELWQTKIHEARILAGIVDLSEMLSEQQMDKWVCDFDSWDLCDQVCMNLFCQNKIAYKKVFDWVKREEEFVRRAGFALIACLAVHDKKAKDKDFVAFFPLIKKYSTDERNFVRKAVNWALRQIGKRNLNLNKKAIVFAKEIQAIDNKTAKWIANDALRELNSQTIQRGLR